MYEKDGFLKPEKLGPTFVGWANNLFDKNEWPLSNSAQTNSGAMHLSRSQEQRLRLDRSLAIGEDSRKYPIAVSVGRRGT
jgi:hypothetical protein